MIEEIVHAETTLAIIVRAEFHCEGIRFFTPDEFSQQLAFMKRPPGYVIAPHVHNPVAREVEFTKEVLFIRSGHLRVDFYSNDQSYIRSTFLRTGDVILLAYGGHGFEMIEESEIIEVKQGPYAGDADKSRFTPVSEAELVFQPDSPSSE